MLLVTTFSEDFNKKWKQSHHNSRFLASYFSCCSVSI